MKPKLIIIGAYWLGLLAPLSMFERPGTHYVDTVRSVSQLREMIVKLDAKGSRGLVLFDHRKHEAVINPDPRATFKTKPGASCSGCHHTASEVTGTPQLWKCASCHRGGGDPNNPRGSDSSEVWSKRAFHQLCIACHQASIKGPIKCGDCHRPARQ